MSLVRDLDLGARSSYIYLNGHRKIRLIMVHLCVHRPIGIQQLDLRYLQVSIARFSRLETTRSPF